MTHFTAFAADIHDAVQARDAARVQQALTQQPAQVNAVTDGGITPLHLAASINDVEIMKLLIARGAQVNAATTKQRYTPLHWAAYVNARGAAQLLITHKANVGAQSKNNRTPLALAVQRGARDVVWCITSQTHAVYRDPFLRLALGATKDRMNDLKKARTIYTELLRMHPESSQVNFGYGLICLSLGDTSRAQLAFQRVVDMNGKNLRARYELAKTHFRLRRPKDARREFKALLAMNPPPDVARNIKRYLVSIKNGTLGTRWKHRVHVQVGAFNDSNVNVGPETDIINIAPIIFGSQSITELILDETSMPRSDTGFLANAMLMSVFDVGKPGTWNIGGTLNYYQNWLNDSPDNETMFVSCEVGAGRSKGRHNLRLPLRVSHINSGHDPLVTMTGIAPSYGYIGGTTRPWRLSGTATLEMRKYNALNDRDGVYGSLRTALRYPFGANQEHSVGLGASLFKDETDAEAYAHLGREWHLGMDLSIAARTTLYGRIRKTLTDYDERESLAPVIRKDDQQQYTLGLKRAMTTRWNVDLNHQYTDNSSSFDLYSYTRSVTTLSTSYVF